MWVLSATYQTPSGPICDAAAVRGADFIARVVFDRISQVQI